MKSLKFNKKYAIVFFLYTLIVFSQSNNSFKIYYSPDKYTNSLNSILAENSNFKEYRLMLGFHIVTKNSSNVDKELFINSLQNFYPNPSSQGVLCLDLENEVYLNLFKFDGDTPEFKNASSQFVWMIQTVKKLRPNVKVGIYGLPFRAYYPTTKNTNKLDAILSESDYIFPSFYTMYPDSQIGRSRNEKYLKDNLETALEYGYRLNKPVIPFTWGVVHPSNKGFAGELVSKKEFLQNINLIKNFRYKNTRVKGIVWWDPDEKSFLKMVKTNIKTTSSDPKFIQSKLMEDYLGNFIKHKK